MNLRNFFNPRGEIANQTESESQNDRLREYLKNEISKTNPFMQATLTPLLYTLALPNNIKRLSRVLDKSDIYYNIIVNPEAYSGDKPTEFDEDKANASYQLGYKIISTRKGDRIHNYGPAWKGLKAKETDESEESGSRKNAKIYIHPNPEKADGLIEQLIDGGFAFKFPSIPDDEDPQVNLDRRDQITIYTSDQKSPEILHSLSGIQKLHPEYFFQKIPLFSAGVSFDNNVLHGIGFTFSDNSFIADKILTPVLKNFPWDGENEPDFSIVEKIKNQFENNEFDPNIPALNIDIKDKFPQLYDHLVIGNY